MKNVVRLFTMVAIVLVSVVATEVNAQGKQKAVRQYDYQMMTTKSIAKQRVELLSSKVGLSEDQKSKVLELEIKLADRQMFLKEKYKGSKDREEVKQAHLEAQAAHEQALKEILTEEQFAKLHTSDVVGQINTANE